MTRRIRFTDCCPNYGKPVTLRELMITPVRTGYIGKPGEAVPIDLPSECGGIVSRDRGGRDRREERGWLDSMPDLHQAKQR